MTKRSEALAGATGSAPSWDEVASQFPNTVEPRRVRGGIAFHWSRKGVGFGVLTLRCTNCVLDVDEEGMSDDFCMDVLKQAFTEAIANRPNAADQPRRSEA